MAPVAWIGSPRALASASRPDAAPANHRPQLAGRHTRAKPLLARDQRAVTDRPLVSIVTPTLNQGGFIEATIRSISARRTTDSSTSWSTAARPTRRSTSSVATRAPTHALAREPDRGMYDADQQGHAPGLGRHPRLPQQRRPLLPVDARAVVARCSRPTCRGCRLRRRLGVRARTPAESGFKPRSLRLPPSGSSSSRASSGARGLAARSGSSMRRCDSPGTSTTGCAWARGGCATVDEVLADRT